MLVSEFGAEQGSKEEEEDADDKIFRVIDQFPKGGLDRRHGQSISQPHC